MFVHGTYRTQKCCQIHHTLLPILGKCESLIIDTGNVIKEADTDPALVWVRKFPRTAAKLNSLQTQRKWRQVQTLIHRPKIFKTMVRGRRSRKAAQVAGTSFVSSRDPELMYCNKWDCINTLTYKVYFIGRRSRTWPLHESKVDVFNILPTSSGAGYQWTESTNTGCNQWLSLAKIALKVPMPVEIVHCWPAPTSVGSV